MRYLFTHDYPPVNYKQNYWDPSYRQEQQSLRAQYNQRYQQQPQLTDEQLEEIAQQQKQKQLQQEQQLEDMQMDRYDIASTRYHWSPERAQEG